MAHPTYLINMRTHLTWTPVLEPLESGDDGSVELPLLGSVSAGQPLDVAEDRETVTVPRQMVRQARIGSSYALRVRGQSMVDDQIQDGDIVIVEQRQTAENGETVVALLNGEQVTLKRFYVETDGIRLQPANPAIEPIYLRHGEIQILGIVFGLVRMSPSAEA